MKLKLILVFLLAQTLSLRSMNQYLNDSLRGNETYNKALELIRIMDYSHAIDTLKVSLNIREKFYSKESYDYGKVHAAIGVAYRNLGNLDKAIDHFLLAEIAYNSKKEENQLAIARLYNNLGILYKNKLNFSTSLDYLFKSLEIFTNNEEITKADIADIYYNIAENYFHQNNYNKALEITDKFLSDAYEDTKMYFLSLKAASLKELKRNKEAHEAYRKSLEYSIAYLSEKDINIVLEYLNFAGFLISVEDFEEAMQIFARTRKIINENNLEYGLIPYGYYRTMGAYYELLKVESNDIQKFQNQKIQNLNRAIEQYTMALKALQMKPEPIEAFTIDNTLSLTHSLSSLKLIADAHAQIADVYYSSASEEKADALDKAISYYNLTAQLIQQARKMMYSDEDKILLAELEEATFFKMIETAYKAYKLDPGHSIIDFAFTSAERMKASSVFDRLSDQLAKENSLVPDSLTDLERTLNYSITTQSELLFNLQHSENQNKEETARIDSMLFQLKKQRDELNQFLEQNFAEYYEMKYANSMLGISEIRQKLKNNEALIEYVLNETDSIPQIYAFFISAEHLDFYKLNADSAFIPALEETFRFISNPGYLFTRNESSVSYCYSAHYLYQTLLQPFEKQMQGKKTTIIPDSKLSYLPFDALLSEMPDTTGLIQFNRLPYVIREHTINYSYSANLLYKFKKHKKFAQNRLMAFAPEYFSDSIRFDNETVVLIPLPGVQREVELIADAVKSNVFRGKEATEKNFREQSGNYDILHLAMHAFINDSLPAFSRFAFTQQENDDPDNDGWLNTADIYNLNLNARLTVLSACNTGRGDLRKGEGVMSLARGFLYAGCPSIVMSMWEVEDNAGTEIMNSFYQFLKKGRSTDVALRQAKLSYLENANPRLAHPHYWLGYVSIGNTDPLYRSYDFYFFGLLILALAGIAADQILHFRRSGKRRYKKEK